MFRRLPLEGQVLLGDMVLIDAGDLEPVDILQRAGGLGRTYIGFTSVYGRIAPASARPVALLTLTPPSPRGRGGIEGDHGFSRGRIRADRWIPLLPFYLVISS